MKKIKDAYKKLIKNRPWYVKVLVFILIVIVGFFLLLGAIDVNFLWLFGDSPSAREIEQNIQNAASEIYSCDGKLMGKYFSENRTPVDYSDISPILIKTLIATEDERFYFHHGIDFQGLVAAAKDFAVHGKARGASTITQQLVKNMYKTRSRKYKRGLLGKIPGIKLLIMKLKEWITAFKIEMRYSKEQILTMYLNTVDFGSNAFGIKTAARTYFNVSPLNLNYEQSAVLIGLLKATSSYNPRMNPNRSLQRRNVVLGNMLRLGNISLQQYDSLILLPIKLDYYVENNYDGQALYFREALASELKDWCKENNVNIYTDGLKIYTTIDSAMQAYAEQAMWEEMQVIQKRFNEHWGKNNPWRDESQREISGFVEKIATRTGYYKFWQKKFDGDTAKLIELLNTPHKMKVFDYALGEKDTTLSVMDSIKYMVRFMHSGFLAIEPSSGHIKAWVGDLDFNFWKYDKVLAMRQPGSTFKLFDYAEFLRQGHNPCEERIDQYVSWQVWDKGKQKLWIPHNADGICFNIPFSIKSAFARSINTIAVQISKEAGIANINATARKMGITSPLNDTIPATCLGGSDLTLLELVTAYSTVINNGIMKKPVFVTKILDRDGNQIYPTQEQNSVDTSDAALDYETAFLMQQMLKGGLTERGSASGTLWTYVTPFTKDTDFGGKTGTSSNHSDAWFVGVTPTLVAGCWVGGEYRCIHFRTGELGQGNRTALPIYGRFVSKYMRDTVFNCYHSKFPAALQPIKRPYNCKQYFTPTFEDSIKVEVEEIDGELDLIEGCF